jgi:hypothetical protein
VTQCRTLFKGAGNKGRRSSSAKPP